MRLIGNEEFEEALASSVAAERRRYEEITHSPEGRVHRSLAMHLALNTPMSAAEAIAALRAAGEPLVEVAAGGCR